MTPWIALAAALALPHHEEISPGVHAAGYADKHRDANSGWIATADGALLIDLPRGIPVPEYLALVEKSTGKPARKLILTQPESADQAMLAELKTRGVERTTTAGGVQYLPFPGGAAVFHSRSKTLFGGPFVVHGPRKGLAKADTASLAATLRKLEELAPAHVVPGFGTWGGLPVLTRHRKFVEELRRQVSYFVCQDKPHANLQKEIAMPAEYQAWMPYDNPQPDEIEHVYRELTVPSAPFKGRAPLPGDGKVHALVLIGDLPHEPGHLEEGLRPVFEATGVEAHFTVDIRALSAENLSRVQLLVILRDGLMRPNTTWMTPAQERAIVEFVEGGKAFLNLHNSMGLYPAGGPYLNLVGGRYIGHGPLERFRVEVVDPNHPVTRGVKDFFAADEQHTPPYDEKKVHLLLRNRSDDGKAVAAAGWAYEPGKGRLCHLANGHTREALHHPMNQLLMRNAVNWCLRRE